MMMYFRAGYGVKQRERLTVERGINDEGIKTKTKIPMILRKPLSKLGTLPGEGREVIEAESKYSITK